MPLLARPNNRIVALETIFTLRLSKEWVQAAVDIFLNLIKMLVAPLILSTIVVGIAHMGDSAALGADRRSARWPGSSPPA
jgi:Na+/H+-dicarboxylate symporter